jgi:hypothetical protein
MIEEIWKPVVGYETYYEVSNIGNIKSLQRTVKRVRYGKEYITILPEHLMSQWINKDGYKKVSLRVNKTRKIVSVHRLVASAFIPNPNNLPQVNHIDENKANNSVDNLEWCTPLENSLHGTCIERIGKASSKTPHVWLQKPVIQCDLHGITIAEFNSIEEAANITGISRSGIQSCCKGRLKTSGRCIWKYK